MAMTNQYNTNAPYSPYVPPAYNTQGDYALNHITIQITLLQPDMFLLLHIFHSLDMFLHLITFNNPKL